MTKILIPMTLVFMMQTAIFLSAVFLSGTFDKMRYNKRTAFYNQTNLRISSIESTAANRWMNVEYTYDKIITAAETLFAEQNLTAKEFMELEDDALKELSTRLINDVAVTRRGLYAHFLFDGVFRGFRRECSRKSLRIVFAGQRSRYKHGGQFRPHDRSGTYGI